MNYLGPATNENGRLRMPDSFGDEERAVTYEALDIDGDILLVASPLHRKRLERVEALAQAAMNEHRTTLEGLAK